MKPKKKSKKLIGYNRPKKTPKKKPKKKPAKKSAFITNEFTTGSAANDTRNGNY